MEGKTRRHCLYVSRSKVGTSQNRQTNLLGDVQDTHCVGRKTRRRSETAGRIAKPIIVGWQRIHPELARDFFQTLKDRQRGTEEIPDFIVCKYRQRRNKRRTILREHLRDLSALLDTSFVFWKT